MIAPKLDRGTDARAITQPRQCARNALGERESGTARLDEAVTAYHAALEERTRERAPLDWAETQNNLGIALRALGIRQSEMTRLHGFIRPSPFQ